MASPASPASAESRGVAQQRTPRRRGPKRKRDPSQNNSSGDVGDVDESREQHEARHAGGDPTCPRCRYYSQEDSWKKRYGSVPDPRFAGRRKAVWLSERPARYGGRWALGCCFCAHWLPRLAGAAAESRGGHGEARPHTKWARYEVTPKDLQSEHVRQHATFCQAHKVATAAYFKPDEAPLLSLSGAPEDDQLLRGAVPQPGHWVSAWRKVITPASWAHMSTTSGTDAYLAQGRAAGVHYRALQSEALIMREVTRETKRAHLRAASSICYLFDDRDGYCNLRYKVDVPTESWDFGDALPQQAAALAGISRRGILGVLPTYKDKSLEDFADDYALRVVEHVKQMIRAFCTPLDDVTDEGLAKKCFDCARVVVVDGALLKVARFLKTYLMKNLVIVIRDASHALRIAAKEPLIRAAGFHEQHARLFSDKHAVLKDIQFSSALKSKLEACQRLIVAHRGAQGGGLTHILRHFSFTPIRFDSFCDPMRAYACIILAVALLLADIASDSRVDAPKRKRAEAALEAMTEPDLLRTGLSADFAEVCVQGLRLWDVNDRDPTTERRDLDVITDRLTALFLDGYVLCDPASDAPSALPAAAEPRGDAEASEAGASGSASTLPRPAGPAAPRVAKTQTVTQIVMEQLKHGFTLRYGTKMHVLKAHTCKSECVKVMAEMRTIVLATLARIEAEWDKHELRACLEAFDLSSWLALARKTGDTRKLYVVKLQRKAMQLIDACGPSVSKEAFGDAIALGTREYKTLVKERPLAEVEAGTMPDSRAAWVRALLVARGTDEAKSMSPVLSLLFCVQIGTGCVERGLGMHKKSAMSTLAEELRTR